MKFYLSTIDPRSGQLARDYPLGLEIAEFCTASNMDEAFSDVDSTVRAEVAGIPNLTLHAPFNELFPCAIDPKARDLARQRYRQAILLAKRYGAEKVVIHGGYHPWIYFPVWYTEQSISFWRDFFKEDPGVMVVLENVLEPEPGMILDIVKGVSHPHFRMCLDIGHAHTYAKIPVMDWLETCGPYIDHFHIHNNDGSWDTHGALDHGTIPMERLLRRADALCPGASAVLEIPEAASSVRWLAEHHFL